MNSAVNSNQAGARDTLDVAAKFSVPLGANGKVFVGSISELAISCLTAIKDATYIEYQD